jgi:hypothetical protein
MLKICPGCWLAVWGLKVPKQTTNKQVCGIENVFWVLAGCMGVESPQADNEQTGGTENMFWLLAGCMGVGNPQTGNEQTEVVVWSECGLCGLDVWLVIWVLFCW